MPIANKKDLFEFLRTSKTFCRKIDEYIGVLELNKEYVQDFKYNSRFFINMNSPQADDAWDEKLMRNQLENLHVHFAHLMQECKNSKNYSIPIGTELGMERGVLVASN